MLSKKEFHLTSSGGPFIVKVQSNSEVMVEIPEEVTWIRDITTRSTSDLVFMFEVEANRGYDTRTAQIVFTSNGMTETVTVIEEQKDALIFLTGNEIIVPDKGGEFEVRLSSNIGFDFSIEGDWIHQLPPTRGLTDSTLYFVADPLPADLVGRKSRVIFSGGPLWTLSVTQKDESPVISFKDASAKAICVERWDVSGDGELTEREVAMVTDLGEGVFAGSDIQSFEELRFFTGIQDIPEACFASCSRLTSVAFPPQLSSIGGWAFNMCPNLTGELVLPDRLKTIGDEAFLNCNLTGTLVLPESLEELGYGAFEGCKGFTGDLVIPEKITTIRADCFAYCSGMKGELTIPETVSSIEACAFYSTSFSRCNVNVRTPCNCDGSAFSKSDYYLIYVPYGTAKTYHVTPGWLDFRERITEEGCVPSDFFYASSDYSRDGEVVCLQKATQGKGIDLVFMGDGFVDKDMEPGGKYETIMRNGMEQFFVYEPYKSFRDWFSVYAVKVVSKHDVFNCPSAERTLSVDGGKDILGNTIRVFNRVADTYADKVSGGVQPARVAIFLNTDNSLGRSFCSIFSDGNYYAWIFKSFDKDPTVINHEAGGHGFGWLGDEYTEFNAVYPQSQTELEGRGSWGKWGAYMNLDWQNSPVLVRWSRFLNDSRYVNEGLGVFEGGARYAYGVYRSTKNSLMNNHSIEGAVFNAPSREAIYKSIMYWGIGADWEYDYEAFVAIDAAGREQAVSAPATKHSSGSSDSRYDFEPGLPPLFFDGPVRDVSISSDGSITIIR